MMTLAKTGLTLALLAVAMPLGGLASAAEFTQEELAFMPASVQLELFRTRMISPVDVLEAQIAQIERTEDRVNAITVPHFEAARRAAAESAKRYRRGTYRELEGITVGVKDEHYDEGWIITMGSLVHKNDPPKDHADPIVAKLKAAGAIPMIQTTAPELYLNFVTATVAWGVSRNPWNLEYAVGGSSGGSGAALLAGYCTLATGSDMGGSIRIPCAFNGLYGLKPGFGYIHTDQPMSIFSGSGPMARTFDDMLLMYEVIDGPGPSSLSVAPAQSFSRVHEGAEGLKLAYVGGMGITEPTDEVAAAMKDAIEVLRAAGATVDVVDFSFGTTPDEMVAEFYKLALAGAMGGLFASYAGTDVELTTYFRYFVEKAAAGGYGNIQLGEAEVYMNRMYRVLAEQVFSKGYDAILCPTMPTSHIPADWDPTKPGAQVVDGDRKFHRLVGSLYTIPFKFLNWCPVASVPAGISSQKMPIGMQIVGKPHETEMVFRIAYAFSRGGPRFFTGDLMPATR